MSVEDRETLKAAFETGDVPTQADFANLIDSSLNQVDDGVVKLPGNPLSINAIGGEEELLNFYRLDDKGVEQGSWELKQMPGGKPGLSIHDASGPSRLFIESGTGNVGIGATNPQEKLQVAGGKIQLDGNQQIKFTDIDTTNNLKVQLWSGYGLGINGSTLFYAANGRHSWRDVNGANERMALTTGADGGLTVVGTGNSSFAGSVRIGTTASSGELEVLCGGSGTWNKLVVTPTSEWGDKNASYVTVGAGGAAGIMLSNPHVTWRDSRASIRYGRSGGVATGRYWDVGVRTGDAFSFAINATDHKLWIDGAGNVGIGTDKPKQSLDVNGRIHVKSGVIQRGGEPITGTNDLGLYSRVNGNWIRIVSTNGPINFYTDGGIGTTKTLSVAASKVSVSTPFEAAGRITSPMWKVTQLFERAPGPLPISKAFTSRGGTLIVFFSGTAWRGSVGLFSMIVSIDATKKYVDLFTNTINSHKAFPSTFFVFQNIKSGTHTLKIAVYNNGTLTDHNDRYHATVLELPF